MHKTFNNYANCVVLYVFGSYAKSFFIHFTIFHKPVGNDAGFLDDIHTFYDKEQIYNGQSHWFLNEVPVCYYVGYSQYCNSPHFSYILMI